MLEDNNMKLDSVVTDVMGMSGNLLGTRLSVMSANRAGADRKVALR
jgi:hypothetical protein